MMEEKKLGNALPPNPGALRQASGAGIHPEALREARRTLGMALETLTKLETLRAIQPPNIKAGINFYDEVKRFELAIIHHALKEARGSQRRAAFLLGLKSTTLNAKIKAYNIEWRNYR